MALTLTRADQHTVVTDDVLARYDEQIVDVDPEVTYTLRTLRAADVQRLRQPYLTYVFDPKSHKRVEGDMAPDAAEALALDLIDFVLIAWAGVVDGAEAAPCTRENKALLDPRRRAALVRVATTNTVTRAEDRAASFRPTAGVGGVDAAHRADHAVLPDSQPGVAGD